MRMSAGEIFIKREQSEGVPVVWLGSRQRWPRHSGKRSDQPQMLGWGLDSDLGL